MSHEKEISDVIDAVLPTTMFSVSKKQKQSLNNSGSHNHYGFYTSDLLLALDDGSFTCQVLVRLPAQRLCIGIISVIKMVTVVPSTL